jgi:hypothetical protein
MPKHDRDVLEEEEAVALTSLEGIRWAAQYPRVFQVRENFSYS